jgi:hypothetical protein
MIFYLRNGFILYDIHGEFSCSTFQPFVFGNQSSKSKFYNIESYSDSVSEIITVIERLCGKTKKMQIILNMELYSFPCVVQSLQRRLSANATIHSEIEVIIKCSCSSAGSYTLIDIGPSFTKVLSLNISKETYSIEGHKTIENKKLRDDIFSSFTNYLCNGITTDKLFSTLCNYNQILEYNTVLSNPENEISDFIFPTYPFSHQNSFSAIFNKDLDNSVFFKNITYFLSNIIEKSDKSNSKLIIISPMTVYAPMNKILLEHFQSDDLKIISEFDLLKGDFETISFGKKDTDFIVTISSFPENNVVKLPVSFWQLSEADDLSVQILLNDIEHYINFSDIQDILIENSFIIGNKTLVKYKLSLDFDDCNNLLVKINTIEGQEFFFQIK